MTLPKAKARLSNLRTQEVSLVDRAANNREFILLKKDDMKTTKVRKAEDVAVAAETQAPAGEVPPPMAPPPQQPLTRDSFPAVTTVKTTESAAPGATMSEQVSAVMKATETAVAKGLSMPGAAKQAILDVIASGIEDLSSLSSVVAEAAVDDTAVPPDDLGAALVEIGTSLASSAQQFMSTAADPNATPTNPDGTPADGAAPPADTADQTAAVDQQQPGPSGQQVPVQMSSPDALVHLAALADSLGAPVQANEIRVAMNALAAQGSPADIAKNLSGLDPVAIAKAGAKMASARLKALKGAHEIIGSLLKELEPATMPTAGGGDAPVKKNDSDGGASIKLGTIEAVSNLTKIVTAQNAEISTLKSLVTQVQKAAGPAMGGGHDDAVETPVAKRQTQTPWPQDLSAQHRNKEMAKGSKA